MKKSLISILLASAALIVALFTCFTYFNANNDLVYVDTSKLLEGYQGMIDARQAYQQKATQWQANIDTLQSELTKAIMDYEKDVRKMTAKEKELNQELIRTKQKQFKDYQQAIQQQSQQEDANMTQQVLDRVNGFITSYGDAHQYAIILGTGNSNILYAKEGKDITDEVLQLLNEEYLGL